MAKTDKADDVVARGADVPLALASQAVTRDALVDPRPGDIIPDNEDKGYHVGEVRQPAEPVLHRDGSVTFETTSDGPTESKFVSPYAEEQAAFNARLAADPAYAGTPFVPIATDPETVAANEKAARGPAPKAARDSDTGGDVIDDLDRDSAAVAKSQAREDKKG